MEGGGERAPPYTESELKFPNCTEHSRKRQTGEVNFILPFLAIFYHFGKFEKILLILIIRPIPEFPYHAP